MGYAPLFLRLYGFIGTVSTSTYTSPTQLGRAHTSTQAGVSKRHGLGYDVRSSQAQRTPNKGSAVPRPLPAPRYSRARGAHVVHLDHPRHGGTPLEEGVHVLRRDEDELPAGLRLADLEQRVDLGWGWG